MSATHLTYPICATSDEERKDWIKVIRKIMFAEKGGGECYFLLVIEFLVQMANTSLCLSSLLDSRLLTSWFSTLSLFAFLTNFSLATLNTAFCVQFELMMSSVTLYYALNSEYCVCMSTIMGSISFHVNVSHDYCCPE